MFKRKIRAKTCFLLGVMAGVLYLLASLLTLLGQGAASFILMSAFAFEGAMLLFLATTEGGERNKTRRYKLLGLFVLLLVSLPNLPPVSTLAGALVLPLLLLMYLQTGRLPTALGLLALELAYVGVDLYTQVALARESAAVSAPTLLPVYVLLALVGVGRAFAAYLLFRQERDKRPDPGEDTRGNYR